MQQVAKSCGATVTPDTAPALRPSRLVPAVGEPQQKTAPSTPWMKRSMPMATTFKDGRGIDGEIRRAGASRIPPAPGLA